MENVKAVRERRLYSKNLFPKRKRKEKSFRLNRSNIVAWEISTNLIFRLVLLRWFSINITFFSTETPMNITDYVVDGIQTHLYCDGCCLFCMFNNHA